MHDSKAAIGSQTFKIITQYGDMLVVKQGIHHHHHQSEQPQQTRPVIMTFHDLGLNSELQFARFCECEEVKLMLQTFTMIHVNFVGQEFLSGAAGGSGMAAASSTPGSEQTGSASTSSLNNLSGSSSCRRPGSYCESLPSDYKYPNVDQMAESVVDICTQLRVRSFIALAVGAGAYVVASLALVRPDLVDGLFLINPVVTSCSITEWLYFKMSAIASNHHIRAESAPHEPGVSSEEASGKHQSGFRRLLNAAHIHLPHQHNKPSATADPVEEASQVDEEREEAIPRPITGSGHQSSRLRRLILSRNFKLGHKHQHRHGGSDDESSSIGTGKQLNRSGSTSSSSTMSSAASGRNLEQLVGAGENKADSNELLESRTKRPPLEYLMYHHFGPSSFQRYRRSSDTPSLALDARQANSECLRDGPSASPTISASSVTEEPTGRRSHKGSESSTGSSEPSSQQGSPRRMQWRGRKQLDGTQKLTSRSNDSLAAGSSSGGSRQRSGSASLSASHLASFSSDRQRSAYMQSVYKHYFCQLNPNNLWLFVQSFAKRKTLNLRKDCGAAAHAAAAAAALGTSICSAFVGMAPPPGPADNNTNSARQEGQVNLERKLEGSERSSRPLRRLESRNELLTGSNQKERPSALVAGTKVKRTFACQTLIMCSNVQMHCERAFKLMSLLNPLQATWIKTDHLLVLDERPEKVCQALRLFLQGIGYSMSTYERRLRLSSATGSASSADSSSGSTRSFVPGPLVSPEAGC